MSRKKLTSEQRLQSWLADVKRRSVHLDELAKRGWEAGQVGSLECDGLRYERFDLQDGTFCVIEWDSDGVCVL